MEGHLDESSNPDLEELAHAVSLDFPVAVFQSHSGLVGIGGSDTPAGTAAAKDGTILKPIVVNNYGRTE